MENGILILILLFAAVSLVLFALHLSIQGYRGKRESKKRLEEIKGDIEETINAGAPSKKNGFLHLLGILGKFLSPRKAGNISEIDRKSVV